MKKIYLLLVLIIPFSVISQNQYFDFFKSLDASEISSGILYDRVFPVAKLTSGDFFSNSHRMTQALAELGHADDQNRFPTAEKIKSLKKQYTANKTVPLALVLSQFQKVNISAFEENHLQVDSNGNVTELEPLSDNHFDTYNLALAGTLFQKHNGMTVTYELPEELLFNTLSDKIISLKTNLGTGEIFSLNPGQPITVTYPTVGKKSLFFFVTLENGTNYTLQSEIEITATETRVVEIIESTLAFQGYDESQAYTGIGEYEIFVDTVDGILDKPIIFVDGFDPGDGRPITAMYDALTYEGGSSNLADEARALGYDMVFLNFPIYQRSGGEIIDGGADYIQRNAYVLIELINLINNEKVGDEELVVIGPSMGGLITRYALKYMEDNSLDHETRLWISFDSPHLGANILIGMQHLINYIAYGPMGDILFQEAMDGLLRSPAAKQMLIDHLDGHLFPGDPVEFDPTIVLPTGAPNFRDVFQNELNTMGYPQLTRNVAISNGAGNGSTTGSPGMNLIEFEFYPEPGGSTRALIDTYFTPAASQTERVDRIRTQIFIFVWITLSTVEAYSMSPAYTSGVDSAPGGQFNIAALAEVAGEIPVIEEFLESLNIDKFNFIPTLSSLAVTSTNDWYSNITEDDITVFDNTFIPDENEIHMTLTEANINFIKDEIFITSAIDDFGLTGIILEHNPIDSSIVLLGNLPQADITLSDISGKILLQTQIKLEERTEIPVVLARGIYILSLENGLEKNQYKLIKK